MKMYKISGMLVCLVMLVAAIALAQNMPADKITYALETEIAYRSDSAGTLNDYQKERCHLDIYYPQGVKDFPTVVWFHGGGMTSGSKFIPEALKNKKIAVVAVNYRLYPKVKCPEYIDDAAAAVAWVFNNIEKYGGSRKLIYVSGHSAGGYLTMMVGLDKKYLAKYGVDANEIAALIPFSGNAITHLAVRQERGIPTTQPLIDEFAPAYYVRKDAPPLVLITGDRELEMLGRYEENAYLARMMKINGHHKTELYELQSFTHGSMGNPAFFILLDKINTFSEQIKKGQTVK